MKAAALITVEEDKERRAQSESKDAEETPEILPDNTLLGVMKTSISKNKNNRRGRETQNNNCSLGFTNYFRFIRSSQRGSE